MTVLIFTALLAASAAAGPLVKIFNATNGPAILSAAPYLDPWWQNETADVWFMPRLGAHHTWLSMVQAELKVYQYQSWPPYSPAGQLQALLVGGANIVPQKTLRAGQPLYSQLYCKPAPQCEILNIEALTMSVGAAVVYCRSFLGN